MELSRIHQLQLTTLIQTGRKTNKHNSTTTNTQREGGRIVYKVNKKEGRIQCVNKLHKQTAGGEERARNVWMRNLKPELEMKETQKSSVQRMRCY